MRKYITLSIVGAASNYATGSFIHCFFNGFWISTKKPQPDLCMKTKSQLLHLLSNTTLRIKAPTHRKCFQNLFSKLGLSRQMAQYTKMYYHLTPHVACCLTSCQHKKSVHNDDKGTRENLHLNSQLVPIYYCHPCANVLLTYDMIFHR